MTFLRRWDRPWRRLGMASVALVVAFHLSIAPALAQVRARNAVLVVDANTGRVLHERSADELRFPASLVKLMTLYMLFEQIELGRMTYKTNIRFSAHAVSQSPSKLDVDEGSEIEALDAIKALVTKSANDVAVAIAEHIGGSEERFAQLMTQRARQIGMKSTTFRNASGLPNPGQVTTARDMITLALRLQDDYARHYHLFSTRTFTFNGDTFRNHNSLLFRYAGLDGMKTGYIRASGFNLVASAKRGKRHVVAVVFGGATAARRNEAMQTYLNMGFVKAADTRTRRATVALVSREKGPAVATIAPAPRPAARPPANLESETSNIEIARVRPVRVPGSAPQPAQPDAIAALLNRDAEPPVERPAAAMAPAVSAPAHATAGSFLIQVGAFQSEGDAQRRLADIRARAGSALGECTAVTHEVRQGDKTFYRARYAGFAAQAPAAAACSALKRLSIDCLVLKADQ
jgi:D-alanyl-D-alanine carboxypeptidase